MCIVRKKMQHGKPATDIKADGPTVIGKGRVILPVSGSIIPAVRK